MCEFASAAMERFFPTEHFGRAPQAMEAFLRNQTQVAEDSVKSALRVRRGSRALAAQLGAGAGDEPQGSVHGQSRGSRHLPLIRGRTGLFDLSLRQFETGSPEPRDGAEIGADSRRPVAPAHTPAGRGGAAELM